MFIGTLAVICLSSFTVSAFPQTAVDNAWTVLHTGLSDKSTSNRSAAVRILGVLDYNPKALDLALQALSDQKPDVRAAAAGALGDMKAQSAIPKLKDLVMTEEDPAVLLAAAHSVIELGDPLGYNVYYAILTGELKSGQGLLDRHTKMLRDPKKMAKFGFEQGIGFVPFAGIGYSAFKLATKDDSSPVRAAAAEVIAKDPDPKSGDALVTAASDKSWIVRAAALDAISRRGDPTLSSRIEPALNDNNSIVRYTAAAAIIHLADTKSANRASTN
jgi:HEAT repeat protein